MAGWTQGSSLVGQHQVREHSQGCCWKKARSRSTCVLFSFLQQEKKGWAGSCSSAKSSLSCLQSKDCHWEMVSATNSSPRNKQLLFWLFRWWTLNRGPKSVLMLYQPQFYNLLKTKNDFCCFIMCFTLNSNISCSYSKSLYLGRSFILTMTSC